MDAKKFLGKYRIESARLKGYDYSRDGAYFITICTKNREYYFGEIVDGELTDTRQAKIANDCWFDLPNHYHNCVLDAFIIMPNHIHGIIFIDNDAVVGGNGVVGGIVVETGFKPVSTDTNPTKRYSLSEIVRGFKTFTARRINEYQNTQGKPFWQTRFHDRIIRNEDEYDRIRKYIIDNPSKWESDRNNWSSLYM